MTDINTEEQIAKSKDSFKRLAVLGDAPVAPAHGIAAIALEMAMRYHDIQMIKDGTLYQQYKLEGRNFAPLHLDVVFETAIQIEVHLLGSSDRIAKLIVEALEVRVEDDGRPPQEDDPALPDEDPAVTGGDHQ